MQPVKVGIIGCGNISGTYLKTLRRFPLVAVTACADVDPERARLRAREHDVPQAGTTEALLADPDIELVVNLTTPNAHCEICKRALEAGKHVSVEKSLAVTTEQGRDLLETARRRDLRIGVAPDTFLGGGFQTAAS